MLDDAKRAPAKSRSSGVRLPRGSRSSTGTSSVGWPSTSPQTVTGETRRHRSRRPDRTGRCPEPTTPTAATPDVDVEQRPDEEEEDDDDDEEEEVVDDGIPRMALVAAGSIGGPIAFGGLWVLSFGGLKALIRRRRRNAADLSQRTANAWREATDRLWESGWRPNRRVSVMEQARRIEADEPSVVGLSSLASAPDRAAFGPTPASEERGDPGVGRLGRRSATGFGRRHRC